MIARKPIPSRRLPPSRLPHSRIASPLLLCLVLLGLVSQHHQHKLSSVLLLCLVLLGLVSCKPKAQDDFIRLTNTGKNYFDRGEAEKAVGVLEKALALNPSHPDAHLNLANAYLLANQPDKALAQAQEVLKQDPNNAAAQYVAGCACLRL